jgi:hypothetical protein
MNDSPKLSDPQENFEPELGQMIFGQPYKAFPVSDLTIAALSSINDELSRVMWNIEQKEYSSPFLNSGGGFECPEFKVEAYSWDDSYEQPYNFKWRDIEISWYKWFGRGASANMKISPERAGEMLTACLAAVRKLDNDD